MYTGLGHCRPLGSWAKTQDLFLQVQTYAFETAKDHASQSCPCSQARLGAELEGRYGQEKLAPTVKWDDKCHFFPECSLPGLDLDVPQAGLGPHLYTALSCGKERMETSGWLRGAGGKVKAFPLPSGS